MFVRMQDNPITQKREIFVTFDMREHERLPAAMRELMTPQQSFGIIMDSCLMACGFSDAKVTEWMNKIPTNPPEETV